MKVKIVAKKMLSSQGQKMVRFQVNVEGTVLTPCIFCRENEFRLRKIENGQFGSDNDVVIYSSYTTVPVENDKDIENKIEEIVHLYKEVWKQVKKWENEKEYIFDL
jgi:hypothetical protein